MLTGIICRHIYNILKKLTYSTSSRFRLTPAALRFKINIVNIVYITTAAPLLSCLSSIQFQQT
jgi:hypothetical protein